MKRFRIDIFFHCILVIIIIILVSPLNNEFLNFEILIYLQCLFEVLNVCISSIIIYDALKKKTCHKGGNLPTSTVTGRLPPFKWSLLKMMIVSNSIIIDDKNVQLCSN